MNKKWIENSIYFILVFFISVTFKLAWEADELHKKINILEEKINSCIEEINTKVDMQELVQIKVLLNEYKAETDDMVFKYQTLDEILKQLGTEAQRRYEKQYGK